jgi:hypothetical protein
MALTTPIRVRGGTGSSPLRGSSPAPPVPSQSTDSAAQGVTTTRLDPLSSITRKRVEYERGLEEHASFVAFPSQLVVFLDRDRRENTQRRLAFADAPPQLYPGPNPAIRVGTIPR